MDDATLDEFGTDESEGDGADEAPGAAVPDAGGSDRSGDAGDTPERSSESGGDDPERPDPVVTTYAWAAAGTCADCGADSPGRWRRDGALVCEACVSWK